MATKEENIKRREKNLRPFKKGKDERRWMQGRPRKWSTTLKENGYKASEIADANSVFLSMRKGELVRVNKDEGATIFERTLAKALLKACGTGSLEAVEILVNRWLGKPRQSIDTNLSGEITVTMNLNQPNED